MKPHDRIFVALDTPDAERALALAARLAGKVGGYKVGLELFGAAGPDVVRRLRDTGARVFVDLKLHDIPNTVAGAAAALARLGASLFTMHALGGSEMLRRGNVAAAEAAGAAGLPAPAALAVTVLTSHDDRSLAAVGVHGPAADAVSRLVAVAREANVNGVVCSARELASVTREYPGALRVVPGIRPAGTARDDQARVATPASALAAGADLLVIGRPITKAPDPAAAADAIAGELVSS